MSSVESIFHVCCVRKTTTIVRRPTHEANHFFGTRKQPCPTGKRFISITFTTTFYSQLVALVSRHHTIELLIYLIVYLITCIYHTTASLDLVVVHKIFYMPIYILFSVSPRIVMPVYYYLIYYFRWLFDFYCQRMCI